MEKKKKKINALDALVIVVLLGAVLFAVYKFFPALGGNSNENVAITYTCEVKNYKKEVIDSITVGSRVTVSANEKDSAVVKAVSPAVPMQVQTFDSVSGTFKIEENPQAYQAIVTLESAGHENDLVIETGNTPIRVGVQLSFRGKGFAAMGYILTVDTKPANQKGDK